MTSFLPRLSTTAPPPSPRGPKLSYDIGDTCWVHVGMTIDNVPMLSPGKVVFWFDLPDLAQRFYVIRLNGDDWLAFEVRDALLMAPTQEAGLPFTHRRQARPPPRGALPWNAT